MPLGYGVVSRISGRIFDTTENKGAKYGTRRHERACVDRNSHKKGSIG